MLQRPYTNVIGFQENWNWDKYRHALCTTKVNDISVEASSEWNEKTEKKVNLCVSGQPVHSLFTTTNS